MRKQGAVFRAKEADFQSTVVQVLEGLGYVVWVTSARSFGLSYKKVLALVVAKGVAQAVAESIAGAVCTKKGYGADLGIPDLLIRRGSWSKGMMFGAELKGEKTRMSTEQKIFEARGEYGVYRALRPLLEDLRSYESLVAGGQPERVGSFLRSNPTLH